MEAKVDDGAWKMEGRPGSEFPSSIFDRCAADKTNENGALQDMRPASHLMTANDAARMIVRMDEWRGRLLAARRQLGLSRDELAARAGLSPATLKSYELGGRHPSRARLTAILDALKIERGARNDILAQGGFVPDGLSMVPGEPRGTFTHEEAAELVRRTPWPAFVVDEYVTVIEANECAQRLWGVDLRTEFTDPVERNLLSVASNPRFADRCLNWVEAVGTVMAVFKRKEWGRPDRLDDPSPVLGAVLQRFMSGDPARVTQLAEIWERVPSTTWDYKMRWSYPVVWRDPVAGVMKFECVVTVASHADSTNFNDWIPIGAESWAALERLTSG